MLVILLLMLLGLLVGIALRRYPKWIRQSERVLNGTIYLLLLLLGIAVGHNEQILTHLSTIGVNALMIMLASVAGSVFFSWIIYRYFFHLK